MSNAVDLNLELSATGLEGKFDGEHGGKPDYDGILVHIMLGIALIGALPIFLLRYQLGGWFSDSQAVSVTVAQLIIPFIVYQFGDGLQINFANALRGIADSDFTQRTLLI